MAGLAPKGLKKPLELIGSLTDQLNQLLALNRNGALPTADYVRMAGELISGLKGKIPGKPKASGSSSERGLCRRRSRWQSWG